MFKPFRKKWKKIETSKQIMSCTIKKKVVYDWVKKLAELVEKKYWRKTVSAFQRFVETSNSKPLVGMKYFYITKQKKNNIENNISVFVKKHISVPWYNTDCQKSDQITHFFPNLNCFLSCAVFQFCYRRYDHFSLQKNKLSCAFLTVKTLKKFIQH